MAILASKGGEKMLQKTWNVFRKMLKATASGISTALKSIVINMPAIWLIAGFILLVLFGFTINKTAGLLISALSCFTLSALLYWKGGD